jgi:hypothetical protein
VAQSKRVRRLLANTNESAQNSALDHWIARYCREIPARPSAEPEDREPQDDREPQELRESVSSSNESAVAQDLAAAEDGDSIGARAVAEAPVLVASPAVGPIEDFVKAVSELPR